MSENRQIEELAATIYTHLRSDSMSRTLASLLYEDGWRKDEKLLINDGKSNNSEFISNNSEWISVEERLPEVGEKVLLYSKPFNCCDIGQYSETFKKFFAMRFNGAKVTHWRPLPDAPKGE